jgi:hypothetical protein
MMFSVRKIDKLMERMTLAEKLGQLTMTAAGYTRHGARDRRRFHGLDPQRDDRQPANSSAHARFTTCSESPSRSRASAFLS